MAKSNDQIFQLSLTEIAFTLVFILLMLLGGMLFSAEKRAAVQQQVLAQVGDLKAQEKRLTEARTALENALSEAPSAKPDEVITALTSQSKLVQERDELKQRIEDLDAQLTALTTIKKAVEDAGKGKGDVARKEVADALALKAKVEKQLKAQPESLQQDTEAQVLAGVTLKAQVEQQLQKQMGRLYPQGQEPELAKELVAAAKQSSDLAKVTGSPETLKKDNADLRGQVAFLKARLDARGGRDYPPCWAEEQTGKVEFLFTIEIYPEGLRVHPAWPAKRKEDASSLPGVEKLTREQTLSLPEFRTLLQGLDQSSKAKNCRHYVYLKNRVHDLDTFNRYRYGVENFFYKLETRG